MKKFRRNWFWFSRILDFIPWSSSKRKSEIFHHCIYSMMAKLSNIDSHISPEEREIFDRFLEQDLGLSSNEKIQAINTFAKARSSPHPFEQYAEALHEHFKSDKQILHSILDLLMSLSFSDSRMCKDEEKLLKYTSSLFGIDQETYSGIKAYYSYLSSENLRSHRRSQSFGSRNYSENSSNKTKGQQFENSQSSQFGAAELKAGLALEYSLLGCKATDSSEHIKRCYRKIALECHPDRLKLRGIPKDFHKHEELRFIRITEAYDKIMGTRTVK